MRRVGKGRPFCWGGAPVMLFAALLSSKDRPRPVFRGFCLVCGAKMPLVGRVTESRGRRRSKQPACSAPTASCRAAARTPTIGTSAAAPATTTPRWCTTGAGADGNEYDTPPRGVEFRFGTSKAQTVDNPPGRLCRWPWSQPQRCRPRPLRAQVQHLRRAHQRGRACPL